MSDPSSSESPKTWTNRIENQKPSEEEEEGGGGKLEMKLSKIDRWFTSPFELNWVVACFMRSPAHHRLRNKAKHRCFKTTYTLNRKIRFQ